AAGWYPVSRAATAGGVFLAALSGLLVALGPGLGAVIPSGGMEELGDPGMPLPGEEGPAWSAALGSTQAMGAPGEPPPGWPPPREPEQPPPWPQPWSPPPPERETERGPEWGSTTESTRVTHALPPEAGPPHD